MSNLKSETQVKQKYGLFCEYYLVSYIGITISY